MHPNFEKKNYWKIFDSKEDTPGIILSPISGPLVSISGQLSDCVLGSGAPFLPFVKKGDPLDHNFGKIIIGNMFDHKDDPLGIILSQISGL